MLISTCNAYFLVIVVIFVIVKKNCPQPSQIMLLPSAGIIYILHYLFNHNSYALNNKVTYK